MKRCFQRHQVRSSKIDHHAKLRNTSTDLEHMLRHRGVVARASTRRRTAVCRSSSDTRRAERGGREARPGHENLACRSARTRPRWRAGAWLSTGGNGRDRRRHVVVAPARRRPFTARAGDRASLASACAATGGHQECESKRGMGGAHGANHRGGFVRCQCGLPSSSRVSNFRPAIRSKGASRKRSAACGSTSRPECLSSLPECLSSRPECLSSLPLLPQLLHDSNPFEELLHSRCLRPFGKLIADGSRVLGSNSRQRVEEG